MLLFELTLLFPFFLVVSVKTINNAGYDSGKQWEVGWKQFIDLLTTHNYPANV